MPQALSMFAGGAMISSVPITAVEIQLAILIDHAG